MKKIIYNEINHKVKLTKRLSGWSQKVLIEYENELVRKNFNDFDLMKYYGINITGNVRLIVKPDAESLEPEILKECDTVIIKGVMDYHGRKNEWLIP